MVAVEPQGKLIECQIPQILCRGIAFRCDLEEHDIGGVPGRLVEFRVHRRVYALAALARAALCMFDHVFP
jgi:hypothetical protein